MEKIIETLLIADNEIKNVSFHNARMNKARADIFGSNTVLDLDEAINIEELNPTIKHRCRVTYNETGIIEIIFTPYEEKKIEILKLIDVGNYEYDHKWLNRDFLLKVLERNPEADDIIMIKNGFVTDSTIANLAFWDGQNWYVPNTPLLKGTKREKLLLDKTITETTIKVADIKKFEKVALINVFRDLNIQNAIDCATIIY
ncbi:MAG: aminotransferase class IV [Pseudarcicella sp.]|nr:aminotransferase class IV [Pseudarcicella sp.]MBP6411147.1 aminotransferase class IV [Pseudarcicella sp.]